MTFIDITGIGIKETLSKVLEIVLTS